MNEQREAVADGPIKSEQQREGHDQLGDAQGVRCRRRQRHSVKATGDARGRVRKNELLDAPLQEKDGEKEPQDEKRGGKAFVDLRRHLTSPWSRSPFERLVSLYQLIRVLDV